MILSSFRCFQTCLAKIKLANLTVLTAFVKTFHSCFKDGSKGTADMRCLSGLYFALRYLSIIFHCLFQNTQGILYWSYQGFLYLLTAVVVGYLKPYKKNYMNLVDTVLLTYMSIFCHLLSRDYFASEEDQILKILTVIPCAFGVVVVLMGTVEAVKLIKSIKCLKVKWNNIIGEHRQPLLDETSEDDESSGQ